ncbi:hypothetical protein [Salinisphaera sp. G21_0]|uniref:hypothetical protein n=1 Tax=Salinisphaera sp. G21_0 TaxID=2821094 RepID=UPI001AD9F221|nr:hypothetical protein [Salinisphaera sp. G21_0]
MLNIICDVANLSVSFLGIGFRFETRYDGLTDTLFSPGVAQCGAQHRKTVLHHPD